VHDFLEDAPGSTALLDTLFQQTPALAPFFTTLLARHPGPPHAHASAAPNATAPGGALTLGAVLPGREAVLAAPRLPLAPPTPGLGQQWAVRLRADDGLRLGGAPHALPDTVVRSPPGASAHDPRMLTAVLDSGFSLSQVPAYVAPSAIAHKLTPGRCRSAVAQMIYGGVPGAVFDADDALWHVPCGAELDVALVLGGALYALHPLDVVLPLDLPDGLCAGSFQPYAFDTHDAQDIILGAPRAAPSAACTRPCALTMASQACRSCAPCTCSRTSGASSPRPRSRTPSRTYNCYPRSRHPHRCAPSSRPRGARAYPRPACPRSRSRRRRACRARGCCSGTWR
jgi:hypothetical protein